MKFTSSKSFSPNNVRFLDHPVSSRHFLFWIGLALLVGLFYIGVAAWGFGVSGFPLDDAWIHQTYARNLAYTGQLAFVPGIPSAGSTAPLWTFLLSVGYLLGLPFKIWTYGLGLLFLGLSGWTAQQLTARLFPESRWLGLGVGLFCLFEWHLVWAAVSGMETILFVWLSLLLVERYLAWQTVPRPRLSHFYLGLLAGLLTLTRPEGVGLIGLIGLDMAYRHWRQKEGIALLKNWIWIGLGIALLLIPYIAFHLWATGLPFPNTLYAKQAEYGIILESFPLWWRLFGNIGPPVESVQGVFRVIFIGPQLLLLPGLGVALWLTVKERRSELTLVWAWWISYLVLYAVRLPVTYQHGRYQIPAIVWVILLGVWGMSRWLEPSPRPPARRFLVRVGRPVMLISLCLLVVSFTLIGAQAYGRDVRIIDSEMVATARWLDRHTAPDALIAAHDIGAIGYFTQRPIIDLAGLITPEVIPIIRDEAALLAFVTHQQADYLVTFPAWYPSLTQHSALQPLFQTGAPWAPQAGGENMVVYRFQGSD